MMQFWHRAAVVVVALALAGCEFLRAASFPLEEGERGGTVTLQAIEVQQTRIAGGTHATAVFEHPADYVEAYCSQSDVVVPQGFVLVPLALAGFQIFYAGAQDRIAAYIEKIKKSLTASYSAKVNIRKFQINDLPTVRCLRLKREVQNNERQASQRLVADVVLGLEPLGETGMVIRPLYLKIDRFAASTRKTEKPRAQIAISVGFTTVGENRNTLLHQANIGVTQYIRGTEYKFAQGREDENDRADSGVMPYPAGQPVSVVIAVTETGDGIDEFEQIEKAFARNAQLIGAALGKILETELTE